MCNSLEIFTQTQYPVEVIPPWKMTLDELAKFDLVTLPETDVLTEAEGSALRDYVAKGGKLLATWKPGLFDERGRQRASFLLADVLGVDFVEEVTKYVGPRGTGFYLELSPHPLASFLGRGEIGFGGAGVGSGPVAAPVVRVKGAAESIMAFRLPLVQSEEEKRLHLDWNTPPPSNEMIPQAITVFRYGEGQGIYAGAPLFRWYKADISWIEEWIRGAVRRLVPSPPLRVEGNDAIHATFFRQGPRRLVVQMANSAVWATAGKAGPAKDLEIIGLTKHFPVRSARLLWPEEQVLNVTPGQDQWRVRIPEVPLHTIVALEQVA